MTSTVDPDGRRAQIAHVIRQLAAAGVYVTENDILRIAAPVITIGPDRDEQDKFRALLAVEPPPRPRNRRERRRAAALTRRAAR